MGFERSWVEIDLDNFSHNLRELKKRLPQNTSFMQIVKADAYGHGAYEIALQSLKLGATYLGVANVEEGALLRYQDIRAPILILSPSFREEIDLILDNNITPTVSSIEFAKALNDSVQGSSFGDEKQLGKVKIHLEIDTGMGRSGVRYDEAEEIVEAIRLLPHLEIEGIFSHFSSSESDQDFTDLQSARFRNLLDKINLTVKYIHIANSSGIITCSSDYANLVRIGLLSYGVYSDERLIDKIDLRPVMVFKSVISQIKDLKRGETVGYNRTFRAERDTRYAIIPVGYADGYDFLLSNKGQVMINDRLYRVIGRISMDMISVDITDSPHLKCGTEVTLLNGGMLRPEQVVSPYEGLSYELLCQIGRRAKRYYHRDRKIVATAPLSRRGFVSRDFSDTKLNLIIESAISQRLQSKEIASLLYGEILKRFFTDKDENIHYRKDFKHSVTFKETQDKRLQDFYEVETTLTFTKILQQEYFYVACANRYEDLEKYFRRRDVEYRWLLDNNFSLSGDSFQVTSVCIDGIELQHENELNDDCMEIRCSHPALNDLVGKEVIFSISTKTYYPRSSHQLAIYVTEITQGVEIIFNYPDKQIAGVEVVSVMSGQSKYPVIEKKVGSIEVRSGSEEWIFPNSGVVFAY